MGKCFSCISTSLDSYLDNTDSYTSDSSSDSSARPDTEHGQTESNPPGKIDIGIQTNFLDILRDVTLHDQSFDTSEDEEIEDPNDLAFDHFTRRTQAYINSTADRPARSVNELGLGDLLANVIRLGQERNRNASD